MAKTFLKVERSFDSAHFLNKYKGKCSNMHGHTWKTIFKFEVLDLKPNGISEDFSDIKKMIDSVLPDHKLLNEVYPTFNPTAEKLCYLLYRDFQNKDLFGKKLPNLFLVSVEVFETPTNSATYEALINDRL